MFELEPYSFKLAPAIPAPVVLFRTWPVNVQPVMVGAGVAVKVGGGCVGPEVGVGVGVILGVGVGVKVGVAVGGVVITGTEPT